MGGQFGPRRDENLTLTGAPVDALKQPRRPRMWAKTMPALGTRLIQ